MRQYLIRAEARWNTWEGNRRDNRPRRLNVKTLDQVFESVNSSEARAEAKRLVDEFKKMLPPEKTLGLGGNSKPEIIQVMFARVLDP